MRSGGVRCRPDREPLCVDKNAAFEPSEPLWVDIAGGNVRAVVEQREGFAAGACAASRTRSPGCHQLGGAASLLSISNAPKRRHGAGSLQGTDQAVTCVGVGWVSTRIGAAALR